MLLQLVRLLAVAAAVRATARRSTCATTPSSGGDVRARRAARRRPARAKRGPRVARRRPRRPLAEGPALRVLFLSGDDEGLFVCPRLESDRDRPGRDRGVRRPRSRAQITAVRGRVRARATRALPGVRALPRREPRRQDARRLGRDGRRLPARPVRAPRKNQRISSSRTRARATPSPRNPQAATATGSGASTGRLSVGWWARGTRELQRGATVGGGTRCARIWKRWRRSLRRCCRPALCTTAPVDSFNFYRGFDQGIHSKALKSAFALAYNVTRSTADHPRATAGACGSTTNSGEGAVFVKGAAAAVVHQWNRMLTGGPAAASAATCASCDGPGGLARGKATYPVERVVPRRTAGKRHARRHHSVAVRPAPRRPEHKTRSSPAG